VSKEKNRLIANREVSKEINRLIGNREVSQGVQETELEYSEQRGE